MTETVWLSEADVILSACRDTGAELGLAVSISVTDPRGDLVAMCRMDGASWRTPDISRAKAVASACMGVPSGELSHRAGDAIFLPFTMMQGGNFIMGQGAVPLYREGQLVGAVGVSGGTPEEDELVARAGARAAGLSGA